MLVSSHLRHGWIFTSELIEKELSQTDCVVVELTGPEDTPLSES